MHGALIQGRGVGTKRPHGEAFIQGRGLRGRNVPLLGKELRHINAALGGLSADKIDRVLCDN